MIIFLFLIPVLALVSSLLLYKHNGKREFLKFDFVQFIYAFLLMPIVFVWIKSLIFVWMKKDLGVFLSVTELFIFDTIFSTLFLFVSFFVVIHSLTKSFELKRSREPLYDMFAHSEFFHQLFSHLAIYAGALLLVGALAFLNLLIPLSAGLNVSIWLIVLLGFIFGLLGSATIWNYESPDPMFLRVMKLIIACLFVFLSAMYFIFDPPFESSLLVYWMVTVLTSTLVFLALVAERPEKKKRSLLPYNINWKKSMYYWRFARKQVTRLTNRS